MSLALDSQKTDRKALDIKEILKVVEPDLRQLDNMLLNEISADSGILCSIMENIFKAGGKRIRPTISFLVFRALEHDAKFTEANKLGLSEEDLNRKILEIAELTELIHTASLVHDDIIDNSLVRRGKETANSTWDNAITVISGDFMFAKAAVDLGKLDCNEIVCLYAKVLEELCDGEIEQADKKYKVEVDWDFYLRKTYKKTASLIEASAKAPACLLRLDEETKNALANYGKNLGMAFQIIDDILDYTQDEKTLGKPAGSDLKEGHLTMPALFYLESLSDETKKEEFRAKIRSFALANIEKKDTELLREDLESIISEIKSGTAIERSFYEAQKHVGEAIRDLEVLGDSKYKKALVDLAQFVISRDK